MLCITASEVRSILEDDAASVNKDSDSYWVLAAALKRYVDNEGRGQLPIEVCMPSEPLAWMNSFTLKYFNLEADGHIIAFSV